MVVICAGCNRNFANEQALQSHDPHSKGCKKSAKFKKTVLRYLNQCENGICSIQDLMERFNLPGTYAIGKTFSDDRFVLSKNTIAAANFVSNKKHGPLVRRWQEPKYFGARPFHFADQFAIKLEKHLMDYQVQNILRTCMLEVKSYGSSGLLANKLDKYVQQELKRHSMSTNYLTNFKEENWVDFSMSMQNGKQIPSVFGKYQQFLMLMLDVEEAQMNVNIRRYDQKAVNLTRNPLRPLFVLKVAGLAEKRPSVLRGDRIHAQECNKSKQVHEGYAHFVNLEDVHVSFDLYSFSDSKAYDIKFTFCRTQLKLMKRAVQLNTRLISYFLQNTAQQKIVAKPFSSKTLAIPNAEQQLAVCTSLTFSAAQPMIIYGPPGTGKTSTLVECLAHLLDSAVKILVTAPSNYAADLIIELLQSRIKNYDFHSIVFRLNATQRSPKSTSELAGSFSNFDGSCYPIPSVEFLKQYAVIVTTCASSGYLYSLGLKPGYFSHIFIDEAAECMIPESLIPLQMAVPGKTKVILAGDPKQLGPVLQSPIAQKYGFDISLLERLVDFEKHGIPCATIIKLRESYRAHPALLQLYSTMFYEDYLHASAPKAKTDCFIGWKYLQNPQYPAMFYHVNGQEAREADSPSWYNSLELQYVIQYVDAIIESGKVAMSEIGVITPYRKQVLKFRQAFHSRGQQMHGNPQYYQPIMVGTTEEFQGQERQVIIISTVRSQQESIQHDLKFKLGFVQSPKRLNVAISRAISMLLIFGNASILSLDRHWLQLLHMINEQNAYIGPTLPTTATQTITTAAYKATDDTEEVSTAWKNMDA